MPNVRPCGTGYKERRVECKQIMAQEHTVERRPELCPSIKPQTRKPCNTKACAPEDQRPPIASSNSTYIQHDAKKTRVITLNLKFLRNKANIFLILGNFKNWRCSRVISWHSGQN